MSKREAEAPAEENGHAEKKAKVEEEEWVIPEKFTKVKEELKCQPWKEGASAQDLIAGMVGNAETDAFFVAGMLEYFTKANRDCKFSCIIPIVFIYPNFSLKIWVSW